MREWRYDTTTLRGLGLMAGAVVEWLLHVIELNELAGAAAIAAVWAGLKQAHAPSSVRNDVQAQTVVVNQAPGAPKEGNRP